MENYENYCKSCNLFKVEICKRYRELQKYFHGNNKIFPNGPQWALEKWSLSVIKHQNVDQAIGRSRIYQMMRH